MNAAGLFLLACLVALGLVELAARLLTEAPSPRPQPGSGLAERRHTRYDADLGWAHVPGTRVVDLYGPGRTLTINAQGFRATREYTPRVGEGRRRVICAGDSFTLGYGVGDDATWCARLESLDAHLETVNMGQGGYGLDQAFLWYARDGASLAHDAVVFAFVRVDFDRMLADRFLGYPKPVLRVRDGRLEVRNVPVPQRDGPRSPLETLAGSLRIVALLRPWIAARGPAPALARGDVAELVTAVFAELRERTARAGRALLLVYLPMRSEWSPDPSPGGDPWRRLLRRAAAARGIPFLDLVPALRSLPEPAASALYIREGALDYAGAAGHLDERGNAWVAERVWARLAPELGVEAATGARTPRARRR